MSGGRGVVANRLDPSLVDLSCLNITAAVGNATDDDDCLARQLLSNQTRRLHSAGAEDPTLRVLRVVAEAYISIPVSLLGIVGNLVSLFVLCYHRRLQKLQTILIQLQVLAVVDTLTLVTMLLMRYV